MVINWLVNGKSTLWGSFLGILFGGWGSVAKRAPWHSRSSIAVWKAEGCWRIEWQVLSSSFSTSISIFQHSFAWETCLFKKVTTKRSKKFQKVSPNPPFSSQVVLLADASKGACEIVTMHLAEDEHHLTWKLQKLPHLSLKADDRGARCPGQGDQERLVALT